MVVVSICDGMSGGQLALNRANIPYKNYYASEIKDIAIKVTQDNFPDTIQLGNINDITHEKLNDLGLIGNVDLILGGTPCQDFSIARAIHGELEGLNGENSSLFYEFLRIKNILNPRYFLVENVKMLKEHEDQLNEYLGVEGIHINSNLVSFQNRSRIYWTNIPGVTIPKDRNINFQDFKETDYEYLKDFKVKRTPSREIMWGDGVNGKCPNITYRNKVNCLTRKQDRWSNSGLIEFEDFCRYLSTKELELAQTVPVGYTKKASKRQAEDLLGDGWTIDVIAHILSFMPKKTKGEC